MKNITIINGHPNRASYNHALQDAYAGAAQAKGFTVTNITLSDLQFDPILRHGYSQRMELEPDLLEAWEKIKAADHLVFIYPQWWGMMPALLKGFFDRLFLPGLAFRYRADSPLWDKLLKGKTAELICTLDYPVWYYRWILREPGNRAFRKMILDFVGIRTTRTTYIGPVRPSSAEQRAAWLKKVASLA